MQEIGPNLTIYERRRAVPRFLLTFTPPALLLGEFHGQSSLHLLRGRYPIEPAQPPQS
jgi:hypothetical protein